MLTMKLSLASHTFHQHPTLLGYEGFQKQGTPPILWGRPVLFLPIYLATAPSSLSG